MKGVITKKHFFQIIRTHDLKIAVRILFSKQSAALNILMGV